MTLLEFDEDVMSYGIQPVQIDYIQDKKKHRYTPDAVVYYKPELERRPLIIEVKYEAELLEKQDLYQARLDAAHLYAAENGYTFRVITEKEISTDYLTNIKFLPIQE